MSPDASMEDRLVFVVGAPRSGTTLLARMLASHSAIYGRPEAHLLTPLAYLGYYDYVQKAPYDQYQAHLAVRDFVADLPRGEQDYLDALRHYTDTLYGRMLAPTGKRFFLDKTPANSLILPFITRLYPRARYVVLTRHPLAVFSSYAESFFDGDYAVAHSHNPILERYVPAIAAFIRQRPAPLVHLRYEDVVRSPQEQLERVFDLLGLPFEPATIEYGAHEHIEKGLGDPLGVGQHRRPVTDSIDKWVVELKADENVQRMMRRIVAALDPADLALWGYPAETLFAPLEEASPPARKRRRAWLPNRYRLQRKLLVLLRRNIHHNALGRALKRLRFALDVLLRE